jgi:hypothetical protein
MGGLGPIVDLDSGSNQEQETATTVHPEVAETKPAALGTVVSPELVDQISERVVTRLRETLREEVKSAIEDALNEYLKELDS